MQKTQRHKPMVIRTSLNVVGYSSFSSSSLSDVGGDCSLTGSSDRRGELSALEVSPRELVPSTDNRVPDDESFPRRIGFEPN